MSHVSHLGVVGGQLLLRFSWPHPNPPPDSPNPCLMAPLSLNTQHGFLVGPRLSHKSSLGPERSSELPKVTKPGRSRALFYIRAWAQVICGVGPLLARVRLSEGNMG